MLKGPVMRRPALTACLALAAGCVGDLVELAPPSRDAGPPGMSDMVVNRNVKFNPDIEMDINTIGCSVISCHGGTQLMVLKNASDTPTIMMNYTQFLAYANMGASSQVLTKNLAGDMVSHSGGKPFASTSDPVYARWLAWIMAGNPQ